MNLSRTSFAALALMCFLSGAHAETTGTAPAAYTDLGAVRLEGTVTLDASTPEFHFATFDMASGSTVIFANLEAGDTLRLIASEAIHVFGELIFAPAGGLYLEAPFIELGEGASIVAPGGSVELRAGRGTVTDLPAAGGGVIIRSGAAIDVSGAAPLHPAEPVLVRGGGSISITPGAGIVTMEAPVPEPETWAMLLAGLGLVGWTARRRRQ